MTQPGPPLNRTTFCPTRNIVHLCERLEVKSLRPTYPKIPILAKGKADTGRIWTYVRDDRPFGGRDPARRCSTPHVIGAASIPRGIFRTSPISCWPMPIAGSMLSSIPDARRCRPRRPSAGHMAGGRSSNLPTSPRTLAGEDRRRRSRPLRWKRFVGLTNCLRSSAISMG